MSDVTEYTQGDYTFYIRPMDPFKALDLLGDLQKAFLPAIGAAFGKVNLGTGDDEKNDKPTGEQEVEQKPEEDADAKKSLTLATLLRQEIDIKGGLLQLSSAINGTNLTNLLQRIIDSEYIAYSHNGGQAIKLDKAAKITIFQGKLSGMFALAWQVLRVNYADFFQMLPSPTGGEKGGGRK